MQVSVTFRHMEPSGALKDYVENKLRKVGKLFYRTADATVVLSVEKHRHKAEVLLKGDRTVMQSSVEEKEGMYEAIDHVVDKIERQAKRYKSKIKDRKGYREERGGLLD